MLTPQSKPVGYTIASEDSGALSQAESSLEDIRREIRSGRPFRIDVIKVDGATAVSITIGLKDGEVLEVSKPSVSVTEPETENEGKEDVDQERDSRWTDPQGSRGIDRWDARWNDLRLSPDAGPEG